MRLKSGIWVAAYIRRCQVEGAQAVLRRRGALRPSREVLYHGKRAQQCGDSGDSEPPGQAPEQQI